MSTISRLLDEQIGDHISSFAASAISAVTSVYPPTARRKISRVSSLDGED